MSLFISETEKLIAEEFQRQGYIIRPVADSNALELIQALTTETAADFLGSTFEDTETFLNQIHQHIDVAKLNSLRLHVIRQMNGQVWFRNTYFQLAKLALEMLVGNELAMQLRINLSIQLPQDESSLLPVHADVWSGDSPYEVVVWLPLVDCYRTKAMYLLPPSADKQLREEFGQWAGRSSEELFRRIENEVTWIEIKAGEVLIFNQNLPHGNRVNQESETRWSMNCRFKSVFTPYGDKKIGEFFEPITLKAASRLGMNYRFPQLPSQSD
jgi:sporadic carbohydrate cluster 2OG-Fe(II) oxygenase